MELKLNFELVPDSCWCSNLRSNLPKAAWDVIRKKAYARANGKCMICGAPTARLEAHERWDYNDQTKVQSLKDIVAVCKPCHEVIHIGRTQLIGKEEQACRHFLNVNNCSYADYRKALGEANAKNRERSRHEWQLNVDNLKKFT